MEEEEEEEEEDEEEEVERTKEEKNPWCASCPSRNPPPRHHAPHHQPPHRGSIVRPAAMPLVEAVRQFQSARADALLVAKWE